MPTMLPSVVDIVHAISECSGLSVLKLSGNSLGVGACAAIAEALAAHPALTHARWSDIFVSRLKSEIPPALVRRGGGGGEGGGEGDAGVDCAGRSIDCSRPSSPRVASRWERSV